MKWLWSLFQRFGFSVSIPLPSFYRVEDDDMYQSNPSEFDDEKAENLPEVKVSRDFLHADKILVEQYKLLKIAYEIMYPGRQMIVTCTYRSVDEQQRLYKQGRYGNTGQIVTYCDGKQKKSKHNYFPSKALDVAILESGKITWDESFFYAIGAIIKKQALKLKWGGDFKNPDYPHIELP